MTPQALAIPRQPTLCGLDDEPVFELTRKRITPHRIVPVGGKHPAVRIKELRHPTGARFVFAARVTRAGGPSEHWKMIQCLALEMP